MFKILVITIFTFFFGFCGSQNDEKKNGKFKKDAPVSDTLVVTYQLDVHSNKIKNTTTKKVDILLNNSRDLLDINNNKLLPINFNKDYVFSSSIQIFSNDLLFENQLLISNDKIKYLKKPVVLDDQKETLNKFLLQGEKEINFKLKEVKSVLKVQSQSCMDADWVKVSLKFEKGSIDFEKLINPCVFNFDSDRDGKNEIYIIGIRNCSQEMYILRIRD